MQSYYVVPVNTQLAEPMIRAAALGLGPDIYDYDPTGGLVTEFPSAVVTSTAIATVVFADNTGQASASAVFSAQQAATAAEAVLVTNQATVTANVQAHQATIQAWIAAHPSGAVLTAAQTLVLAEWMNGLCNLMLGAFSSTTGT